MTSPSTEAKTAVMYWDGGERAITPREKATIEEHGPSCYTVALVPAQAVDPADPWRGLYLPARMPAPSEYGDLTHPDIPLWPDDREDALDKLVHAQGFDFHIVAGDFTEEAMEDGDELYWQELRAWNPEAPEGEWRPAWKGYTEDGPYAWFVRPMALRPEPVALAARQPGTQVPVCSGGFVIGNDSGDKYMAWGKVGPEWTPDRSAALWLVRRADAEALADENEDAWLILPVERCTLPPNGWACTLASGHDGPCPTIAAPLAQGIDLEKARDEGHDGAIRYVLGYLNGVGDWGSTQYVEILNACDRERIIQSAVQDGELEFTGLGRWVAERGTDKDRALIDQRDAAPGVPQ
ncbi:hypothetical protein V8017_11435 [Stenotrophomonas rhizophila]